MFTLFWELKQLADNLFSQKCQGGRTFQGFTLVFKSQKNLAAAKDQAAAEAKSPKKKEVVL